MDVAFNVLRTLLFIFKAFIGCSIFSCRLKPYSTSNCCRRLSFFSSKMEERDTNIFHVRVNISQIAKNLATSYKQYFFSDQTSEYLYFINHGLVRTTKLRHENTTKHSLNLLLTSCRTYFHMCRLKLSQ